MTKELLFSVTSKDLKIDYFRGTGKGGQKRNKTESGVRITHIDSEAVGKSDETRSQHKNKKLAFTKMANSAKFKAWRKIETSKAIGKYIDIDDKVDYEMKNNIKIEYL